ncbi:MAG: NUDIX hydrolase [Syntrophorhabdaceae bacterium]|nr:NUDIX hydrolase [Syntrophorhabdaceae bacterium]
MPPVPRNAATVVLLKDKAQGGLEVFLVKRHEKSVFMGNNYVFPGGVVDREDYNEEILEFCSGLPDDESKKALIPFYVAGIRELFEEAGVLIAYNKEGKPFVIKDEETAERLNRYRVQLHRKEITMGQIAEKEGLLYGIDRLYHFAHWITPEARPIRFNTHFFLSFCPEGQIPSADRKEITEGLWITPYDALVENLRKKIVLSPPTLKILEDICHLKNKEEAVRYAYDCDKTPVLSLLIKIGGVECLIFPWDPDYEEYKSGNIPPSVHHGRVSTPKDISTRVITEGGCNIPYCKD